MTLILDAVGLVFYDGDEDEDEWHSYNCCCETCLQNHPERDALYNDNEFYGLPDEDDDDTDEALEHEAWCQGGCDGMIRVEGGMATVPCECRCHEGE